MYFIKIVNLSFEFRPTQVWSSEGKGWWSLLKRKTWKKLVRNLSPMWTLLEHPSDSQRHWMDCLAFNHDFELTQSHGQKQSIIRCTHTHERWVKASCQPLRLWPLSALGLAGIVKHTLIMSKIYVDKNPSTFFFSILISRPLFVCTTYLSFEQPL